MSVNRFEESYKGQPPWDIDGPQPAIAALAEAGRFHGRVLDAGCGTGENALYLAARGHEVLGVDLVQAAIDQARAKALGRDVAARFEVADALALDTLGEQFDTIIDCGLFHTFEESQRADYSRGLGAVLHPGGRLFLLCFSDEEPPGNGPRRIRADEIRDAFQEGWAVTSIQPTRFQTAAHAAGEFTPGGPHAWLATIERTA